MAPRVAGLLPRRRDGRDPDPLGGPVDGASAGSTPAAGIRTGSVHHQSGDDAVHLPHLGTGHRSLARAQGDTATRLIPRGGHAALSFVVLALITSAALGPPTVISWALFCMSSTFLSLAPPAVAIGRSRCRSQAVRCRRTTLRSSSASSWCSGASAWLVDGFGALGWSREAGGVSRRNDRLPLAAGLLSYGWFSCARRKKKVRIIPAPMNGILIIAHDPLASALRARCSACLSRKCLGRWRCWTIRTQDVELGIEAQARALLAPHAGTRGR